MRGSTGNIHTNELIKVLCSMRPYVVQICHMSPPVAWATAGDHTAERGKAAPSSRRDGLHSLALGVALLEEGLMKTSPALYEERTRARRRTEAVASSSSRHASYSSRQHPRHLHVPLRWAQVLPGVKISTPASRMSRIVCLISRALAKAQHDRRLGHHARVDLARARARRSTRGTRSPVAHLQPLHRLDVVRVHVEAGAAMIATTRPEVLLIGGEALRRIVGRLLDAADHARVVLSPPSGMSSRSPA